MPEGAFLARLGGDEFVALLVGLTLAEGAALAFRLRRDLLDGLGPDGLTASFGLSAKRPGEPLRSTLERADLAPLRRAKARGKDRVETAP